MVARRAEGGVGAAAAVAEDGVDVAAVADGGVAAAAVAAAAPRVDDRVVVAFGVVEVFVVRFVARGVLEEDDDVDGVRRLRCLFASVLICVMMLLTASSTPGACGHTG